MPNELRGPRRWIWRKIWVQLSAYDLMCRVRVRAINGAPLTFRSTYRIEPPWPVIAWRGAKKSLGLPIRRGLGFGDQWAYSSEEFGEELVRLSECREVSGIIDERQVLIGCLDVGIVLGGQRSQRDHVTSALEEEEWHIKASAQPTSVI